MKDQATEENLLFHPENLVIGTFYKSLGPLALSYSKEFFICFLNKVR